MYPPLNAHINTLHINPDILDDGHFNYEDTLCANKVKFETLNPIEGFPMERL